MVRSLSFMDLAFIALMVIGLAGLVGGYAGWLIESGLRRRDIRDRDRLVARLRADLDRARSGRRSPLARCRRRDRRREFQP